MAKKKRITRKQLLKEPDEFITTTGKLIRFAQTYQKHISYTIGALILVLLVVMAGRYYADIREKRAFSLFDQAMDKYVTAKNNNGIQTAYPQVQTDFELILKKYSGNSGGKITRLAFADISYQAGDFDRAIDLYSLALKDFEGDAFYSKLIRSSIGYAQEGKNDLDAAAKTFEAMASDSETFLGDEALFRLGQVYEAMGNKDKSRAVFQRIVSEYPASMYFNIVSEKLSALK